MQGVTIGEAARRPAGRRACCHDLEREGLVVPARTASGYRRYGIRELNQLSTLAELRRAFGVELTEVAFALRLRRARARAAVETWLAGTASGAARRRGSNGSSASTSACSRRVTPPDDLTTEKTRS